MQHRLAPIRDIERGNTKTVPDTYENQIQSACTKSPPDGTKTIASGFIVQSITNLRSFPTKNKREAANENENNPMVLFKLKQIVNFILQTRIGWIAKTILLNRVEPTARISYSQEGEDLLIDRYFRGKKTGFFIDVGAHHPSRLSNTCLFYKRGWSGINIDPLPGSITRFKSKRLRDSNHQTGIASRAETLKYHSFNEPAVNTFDATLASQRSREGWRLQTIVDIPVVPLKDLLDQVLKIPTEIDFMSVDVEGLDLDVLSSNNWDLYRPTLIVVEILDSQLESALKSEISCFLAGHGYRMFAKLHHSCLFERVR